tara:strand:- start:3160 stop:4512 length:1353 start_codon:yes stop_codon:yes gene_type:complete
MAFAAAAAAAVAGGASIAGSVLDNKANKKISKELQKQADAKAALIQKYGQRRVDSLTPAYNAARDTMQTATNRNLSLAGQTFQPMIETGQAGDYMAQQMINAGVTNARAARRGDAVDNSLYTPKNVPVNYSPLAGLTNPAPVEYAGFEMPVYNSAKGEEKDAALAAAAAAADQSDANEVSSALGGTLATGAAAIGLGLAVPSILKGVAAGTGIGATVAKFGADALGAVKGVLGGSGAAVGTLLSNPLTWGAGALLLAVKNDFWKDPDGYVRSNSGFFVAPTPSAEDRAFAIEPFESGFQGTGFNRRGSQEDANQVIGVFREADSLITQAVRAAGGNIDLSKATLNGVNQDGQYGTSGTFMGVGGKTSNLDLQVDFYAQQLADHVSGLDADILRQLKSAETAIEIVNILENSTVNNANSDTKQGASFSTEQVSNALNSGATWGSNNSGSAG